MRELEQPSAAAGDESVDDLRFGRGAHLPLALLVSSTLIIVPAVALGQSATFEGIGSLGGSGSVIDGLGHSVSADGDVIVGRSRITGNTEFHAFRWRSGTMADLGTLGGTFSAAYGVSADGNVVVGGSNIAGDAFFHAFRWTSGVMSDLGTLGGTGSQANGASADGSMVVGSSGVAGNTATHAFRWNGGSMLDLGTLGGTNSEAVGVSANGNVVVGYSAITGDAANHAFRWTGGVMSDLGTLGGSNSISLAVSADGNVVVGYSAITGDTANHAFRWTGGVMADLGTLGGSTSQAYGVSTNGNVVVGRSLIVGDSANQAFRWTAVTGMQSVPTLLANAGVNLGSWQLYQATGVSADGSVIVGNALNPTGNDEAWVARLCDVPSTCSGLITMSDQMQSFASIGAVAQTASAGLNMNFSTIMEYVTQSGSATASGTQGSAFTAAGFDSDPTVSGTLGTTKRLNSEGLIAGATVGADYIKTDHMHDSGSAKMQAGTLALFIGQVPNAGWQWVAGTNGIYLTGHIDRGYLNGVTAVTSKGHTNGQGIGLATRVGYTFANLWPNVNVTPFASYTAARVNFGGYTETTGPFPAIIEPFHNSEQVSRLGFNARYTFFPGTWTWAALAWGHRLDSGRSPGISGTLIGLFPLSTLGGVTTPKNWLETTGGLRWSPWKNVAAIVSLTANVPDRGTANYVARFNISQAF